MVFLARRVERLLDGGDVLARRLELTFDFDELRHHLVALLYIWQEVFT